MASTRPAKPLAGDEEARGEAVMHRNYTVKCLRSAETAGTAQAMTVDILCAEKSAFYDRDFVYHLGVTRRGTVRSESGCATHAFLFSDDTLESQPSHTRPEFIHSAVSRGRPAGAGTALHAADGGGQRAHRSGPAGRRRSREQFPRNIPRQVRAGAIGDAGPRPATRRRAA